MRSWLYWLSVGWLQYLCCKLQFNGLSADMQVFITLIGDDPESLKERGEFG